MTMLSKFFTAVFLIFTSFNLASGTTVVSVLRGDHEVHIAADSLVQASRPDGTIVQLQTACKIREVRHKLFFTMTGVFKSNRTDVLTLLRKVFQPEVSIHAGVAQAERDFRHYHSETARERRQDANRRIASLHLFGAEDNKLIFYSGKFVADEKTVSMTVRVESRMCPGNSKCPRSDEREVAVYGATEGLKEYFAQREKPDIVHWLTGAIDAAAMARPNMVAGPADIIAVNRVGARWLKVKPECE